MQGTLTDPHDVIATDVNPGWMRVLTGVGEHSWPIARIEAIHLTHGGAERSVGRPPKSTLRFRVAGSFYEVKGDVEQLTALRDAIELAWRRL